MLTPHIVCQTPRGEADFSCSSFSSLCISDLSLSSCYEVAKKVCSNKAEGSYVINSMLNVIFKLYSFLSCV